MHSSHAASRGEFCKGFFKFEEFRYLIDVNIIGTFNLLKNAINKSFYLIHNPYEKRIQIIKKYKKNLCNLRNLWFPLFHHLLMRLLS